MKIAVLGYGLIGKERVQALLDLRADGHPIETVAVYDPYVSLPSFGALRGVAGSESLEAVSALKPDWVIVATPHDIAVELVEQILPWGSRILMEKPFGRSLSEAQCLASQIRYPGQLWLGLNYRFFPGIAQAISDARQGIFGAIISVTMVLGHGGSPGMEKGWKFNAIKAGGGCLIDPGIHLLDLCHLVSPSGVTPLQGWRWTGFWKTGIEEECHLLLQGADFVINLQVSVVRWRSTFRLEIQGTEGYGIVIGRGRSYGPQEYIRGKRWGWQNASTQADSEDHVLTSDCGTSFRDELHCLIFPDESNALLTACSSDQALTLMKTYEACLKVVR